MRTMDVSLLLINILYLRVYKGVVDFKLELSEEKI
jgi:hypothetical protein